MPYCAEADPEIKSKQIFNHRGEITNMLDTSCRTCQMVKVNKSLSYNGLDVNSNIVERYMGVAVNVSQNGIQIETDRRINMEHILLMFFDFQSNYASARGKMIYSNRDESGKFKTGIQSLGKNGDNVNFVKRLIKSYHYQKKVPIFVT